jgi:hypothetical protein
MSAPKKTHQARGDAAVREDALKARIESVEAQLTSALGIYGLALPPDEYSAVVRAYASGHDVAVDAVCRIVGHRLHLANKEMNAEGADDSIF